MDVQNNKNIYNSVCHLGLFFRHVRFIILFRQVSGKLGNLAMCTPYTPRLLVLLTSTFCIAHIEWLYRATYWMYIQSFKLISQSMMKEKPETIERGKGSHGTLHCSDHCFIFPSLLATRGLAPEDQKCPIKMKSKETRYKCRSIYTFWRINLNLGGHECRKWILAYFWLKSKSK